MGGVDTRDQFAADVFAYRATKDGKVLLSWRGRPIKTLPARRRGVSGAGATGRTVAGPNC